MSIELLTGASGAGKSRHLIERVNRELDRGRTVVTAVCSDYPWPRDHGAFLVLRRLICRENGLTCPLHYFITEAELSQVLSSTPAGALVAIDEAFAFGPEVVADWLEASARGIEILAAAPSYHQIHALRSQETLERNFKMTCQRCNQLEGIHVTISAESNKTMTVCESCVEILRQEAETEIGRLLMEEEPFPGQESTYQPIELPAMAEWELARPDSASRADAVAEVLREVGGWPRNPGSPELSYLDIGCNTGFFCNYFANNGFRAKGVDATSRFVSVARLLDSYWRRQLRPSQQFVLYERANAYEYLRDSQDEIFDVTSAFAVFQWIMVQRSVEHGRECIAWLAAKTRSVCVLEMGYTKEEMYKDAIGEVIDREWVIEALTELGNFETIRVLNASPGALQRDVFVGIKAPQPTDPG